MILVTGANSFIGNALLQELKRRGIPSRGSVRSLSNYKHAQDIKVIEVGDMRENVDWTRALTGVNVVIHCASINNNRRNSRINSYDDYYSTNVTGTSRLAEQAVQMGVKRIIYLSSIKVLGETSDVKRPLCHDDPPNPHGFYAMSKLEAEERLISVCVNSQLEVVVIRPPLVYGPGVTGNMRSLIRLVKSRIPLPLGGLGNLRSFLYIDNLVDLLLICVEHPHAVGKIFLASDGQDISTENLLKIIATECGCTLRLLTMPDGYLMNAAKLFGVANKLASLTGSLQVNADYTFTSLNWYPRVSLEDGLKRMIS